jgi:HK97 family phage major capsid protein
MRTAEPSIHETRALIAQTLAHHYRELGSTVDRSLPKFSVARALGAMTNRNAYLDGYEREILEGAAMTAGRSFDPFRPVFPWAALASRAMASTPGAKGGFMIDAAALTASDVLRPFSVTARAGVQFFENLTADIVIPRVSTAPSGAWLGDNVAASPSDADLGAVSLKQRTFVDVTEISLQLLRQAEQAEELLRTQLLGAAGAALDAAVLAGSGGAQPLGLASMTPIPTQSGSSFAYSTATAILKTLADARLDDSRAVFIAASDVRKLLQEREKVSTTARYIWDDDKIANRSAYCSPDLPNGSLVAGDFSKVIVGIWGSGIQVEINPNQDFNRGRAAVRVVLMGDVGVLQYGAFVRSLNVT